jgi:YesN/AraC family two-component response regulator
MMGSFPLMIVDDEPHVRSLLRQCIDWNSLGIEIVAEAGSADEALAVASRRPLSIVCVDICMPVMDGIELARAIRYLSPDAEIVMISGHDNFEYAQRCIRLGVADYLLKPIQEDYLAGVMKKICGRLSLRSRLPSETRERESSLSPAEIVPESPVKGNATICEIVAFIKENYMRPDLSLQSVAQAFYLNPSYVCRAFKQETGENWVDYLTRIRMDRAMQLLRATDKRVYEIAQEVGYSDAKYFSSSFKNFSGQTVHEFRASSVLSKLRD